MALSPIEKELQRLEADLKQLEGEYNMYFSGRLKTPPWETRKRVETQVKQLDRSPIINTGDRFRFTTLQTRYAAFIDLWDRALKAKEEGRSGPFVHQRPTANIGPPRPEDRIVNVSSFRDPMREIDKLHELYDSLAEARRDAAKAQLALLLAGTRAEEIAEARAKVDVARATLGNAETGFRRQEELVKRDVASRQA